MAVVDNPLTGDDLTLTVYRWSDKEVTSGSVNGTNTTFTTANTIVNVTGIDSSIKPDYTDASGNVQLRDIAIYYRKDGLDTLVDESDISSVSGTTITFASAPTTSQADSIVASYAYSSSDDGTTDFTYYVKSYDPKSGSKDVSSEKVCGGRSYKKIGSQDLAELSLELLKKDVLLSQVLNGDVVVTTDVTGYTVKSTGAANSVTPRCVYLKHTDPTNSNEFIGHLLRNVNGAEVSASGGAEDSLTESITVKCNPQDYQEISKEQT